MTIIVETKFKDGVKFIVAVTKGEPDIFIQGVGIHAVGRRYATLENRLRLGALGFKEVGYDGLSDCFLFVEGPLRAVRYRIAKTLMRLYLTTIWFLYDNARMFKTIPAGEMFCWYYFTPFCWYRGVRKKVIKRKKDK